MTHPAHIRRATHADIPHLYRIARALGARRGEGHFETCLAQKRDIFLAVAQDAPVGFAQINWTPNYPDFRAAGIPEIQDLNVLPDFRRRGIGRGLVAHCEAVARQAGKDRIGIGVGLGHPYGPAQRLYVKMGYVPDGKGILYDDAPVRPGELRPVDDDLTLKFVKILG